MKKAGPYLSMLMVALLLFPVLEKVKHDFEHLNAEDCKIKGTHYCAVEHTCSICDYVFSTASTPPKTQDQLLVFAKQANDPVTVLVLNPTISHKFRLSLRGPPAC